ncbi:MAG: cytochrome c nitrite reductase small subunit [Phycisphaerales bacterium]|nr:cytochrome c nitrite reductase small subunit [Phycisphaerales bacterium]
MRRKWLAQLLGVAVPFAVVACGAAVGVGLYTFVYAHGASYMTNDPRACVNCHIMQEQYDGWIHGSHSAVATCNDCHTPHDFFGKYLTKAINGYNHSLAFTTGRFHEPIEITPRNAAITEQACRYCHSQVVHQIDLVPGGEPMSCIRCHRSVGHLH